MTRALVIGSRLAALVVAMLAAGVTTAPGRAQQADGAGAGLSRRDAFARAHVLAALGGEMFRDPSLSASGQLACATCHDPAHAFGPANDRAVQLGGPTLRTPGRRAVPSLEYLQAVPPFTEHFFESDDEGDRSVDNGPTGGLTWDGRVDRASAQARIPLLSPIEMANHSAADVMTRVATSRSASAFVAAFGRSALDDAEAGLVDVGLALETYQQDFRAFYPYDSKYDASLEGRAQLSPAETRGLEAFDDPARGNCARCHPSHPDAMGSPPAFTDYGLVALGVPRNPRIPANADPRYADLGLCGPERTDLANRHDYCGRFMTPTLRNVATRRVFFHNGVFGTLEQAVAFYATRDTRPERWYPRDATGRVMKFDDLPSVFWPNIENEPPFGRSPGGQPALSPADVQDIVAFLKTLTDGTGR